VQGVPHSFIHPSPYFRSPPLTSLRSRARKIELGGLEERYKEPELGLNLVLTSGGNNFNNFRDNQLTKFRFLPTPLNFYEESRFVPSI